MTDPRVAFPASPREEYFNQLLWHLGIVRRPYKTGIRGRDNAVVDWIRLERSGPLRRQDSGGHE